jgi:hypothetical protein
MTLSFLRRKELVRGVWKKGDSQNFTTMSYAFHKYSVHTSENNEFGSSAECSVIFSSTGFLPIIEPSL